MSAREALSVFAAMEGVNGMLMGIQDYGGYDIGSEFALSGTYSEHGAEVTISSASLNGAPLNLSFSGSLSGTWGENLAWSGTWTGSHGSETVSGNDLGVWLWDASDAGYYGFDFDQSGESGSLLTLAKVPWWVRGLEVAGGVAAGAVTRSVRVGVGAGIGLWKLSSWGYSRTPPPPPPPPVRPPVPQQVPPPVQICSFYSDINVQGDQKITVEKKINVTISLKTAATWDNQYKSLQGTVVTTPDPGSLALLGVGGLILLGRRRRREL
ncbi:MAG: PEP-CTERM sorting domain-containing protein [Planctomycetes bacterium]|nr:PEP-CTERM sorting domain-containing protein [Planctomycetota bacterium]